MPFLEFALQTACPIYSEHFPDEMEDTGFFKGIVRTARDIQVPKEVIDAFRDTQWDALQVVKAWYIVYGQCVCVNLCISGYICV